MISDDAGYELVGTSYAMILAGLIVTTRMIYVMDVAVCKPSTNELNEFSFNHIRQLHEKNKEKEEKPPN
jgi:hypothetical protein